jgi:hypothetical protein
MSEWYTLFADWGSLPASFRRRRGADAGVRKYVEERDEEDNKGASKKATWYKVKNKGLTPLLPFALRGAKLYVLRQFENMLAAKHNFLIVS